MRLMEFEECRACVQTEGIKLLHSSSSKASIRRFETIKRLLISAKSDQSSYKIVSKVLPGFLSFKSRQIYLNHAGLIRQKWFT